MRTNAIMLADNSLFVYLDEHNIDAEVQARVFKHLGATWEKLGRIGREYNEEYLANYLIEHDICTLEPILAAIREAASRRRTTAVTQRHCTRQAR